MRFEVYRDKKGDWRWRLVAANGRTVADSSEGYKNQKDAVEIIETIGENARQGIALQLETKINVLGR